MTKPTDDEINEVLDWCMEADQNGTHYAGQTYEEGVRAAIDWMNGDTDDNPMG